MKRLRHRLGRWLLRDAGVAVDIVPDCRGWSEKLRAQLQ